jgi:PhoH-like ATPase
MVSNDAALRIKAAHLGVRGRRAPADAPHRDLAGDGLVDHRDRHDIVDCLYAAGAWTADAVERPQRSARTSSPSCGRARSPRSPGGWVTSCGCWRTPGRRRGACAARSKEQRFALELLLDPAIEVVALDGRAGTGKTLLAVARASSRSSSTAATSASPSTARSCPSGAPTWASCPAGLDEKLDPWMAAIHDAVVALTDQHSNVDARNLIDELTARGQLSLESVTFLRGRSLQRQMVVIDEAQNLEPTTLRTILTAVGEGTKVVFTGDTSQIDAPVPRRVEQRARRADPRLQRPVLLRPHHAHRVRAQRRRQPRRRAPLTTRAPRTRGGRATRVRHAVGVRRAALSRTAYSVPSTLHPSVSCGWAPHEALGCTKHSGGRGGAGGRTGV